MQNASDGMMRTFTGPWIRAAVFLWKLSKTLTAFHPRWKSAKAA